MSRFIKVVGVVAIASLSGTGLVGAGETSNGEPDDSAPAAAQEVSVAAVPPSSPTLYFSLDSESELYALDTTDATPTLLGPTGVNSSTVGLSESPDPGVLYGSTWQDLSRINADGSGFTPAGTDALLAEGLAYDPVNDILYKNLNGNFATASQTTGATITNLTGSGEDPEGLAWRGTDGLIYGFGFQSDDLWAYTPGTDSWAVVGATGIVDNLDAAGLAWDPIQDVLYLIVESGNLYRIDPDTAAATLIGDTGLPDGGGLAFLAGPTPPTPPFPSFTG